MFKVGEKLNASFAAILAVNCADVLINRLKKKSKVKYNMAQEGWICPRCGKVNAPWVMQCSCNRNTQILPKVGAPYYEGDQATCNAKKELEEA